MRLILCQAVLHNILQVLTLVVWLATGAAFAQSPVTVTIHPKAGGYVIPEDFLGLSFETSNLLADKNGKHLFSAENQALIALFRAIGIKCLRLGGGTADMPNYAIPGPADIDQLFAFADAADVKVIYTLRLLNGEKTNAVAIARYIANHYRNRLICFSLGNEPDWHAYHNYPGHDSDPAITETTPGLPGSAYPSFLAKWRSFAQEIVRAVPGAQFGGPDTGSNYPEPGAKNTDMDGRSWTDRFAQDEKSSGSIAMAFLHDYVGQDAADVSPKAAIEAMLSNNWATTNYPSLYEHVGARLQSLGLSYRITECNDYTGGVDGASNAFVSALWALEYLHWQSARGAAGVNFHNKRWIRTCTIYEDSTGAFRINPKAYGLKAFALAGHGSVEVLTLSNPESVRLSAYSVRNGSEHFITLINKEHGPGSHDVQVTVEPGATGSAAVLFLTAPDEDPGSKSGVTLGGAAIGSDGWWSGKWQPIPAVRSGEYTVTVPAVSAAIVRISVEKS